MNYATRHPEARTNHTTHTPTPSAGACVRVALAAAPTIGANFSKPAPVRQSANASQVLGYLDTVRSAARFFGL